MNFILNKAVLPKTNRIKEKSRLVKSVDLNLLENKYNNINLVSLLKDNNLDNLLKDLFNNIISNDNLNKDVTKMYEIIFNLFILIFFSITSLFLVYYFFLVHHF